MTLELSFTVPGEPKGKGRPRFLKTGRTYTPAATVEYERRIATKAAEAMPCPPTALPVSVRLVAYKNIPVSWSKAKRQRAMDGYEIPAKPDLDNIAKAVLDALNGVVYVDDVQVTRLVVTKLFSDEPRLEVTVRELIE